MVNNGQRQKYFDNENVHNLLSLIHKFHKFLKYATKVDLCLNLFSINIFNIRAMFSINIKIDLY